MMDEEDKDELMDMAVAALLFVGAGVTPISNKKPQS